MALLKPWTEAITMGDALLRSADARPQHIAIRRHDPIAGEIVVHFPRAGFLVQPA